MKKITSFWTESCEWCWEIREKYRLRQQIVNKLGLEAFSDDLLRYATCPFHKATAYFSALDRKAEIIIEENNVIAHWWTNYYDYKLVFDLKEQVCEWETNHEPSSDVPSDRFDFNSLFRELLMQMNKEQLEKTLQIIEIIDKKPIEYIMQKFEQRSTPTNEEIEVDGKTYRVSAKLVLECSDKPVTSCLQGFFEHEGQKYYKTGKYVYKLKQ